jgi:hypothetical protein
VAPLEEAESFTVSMASPTGQAFALTSMVSGGEAADVVHAAKTGAQAEAFVQLASGAGKLALRLDPELRAAASEGALFSRITPEELVSRAERPVTAAEAQAAQAAASLIRDEGGTTSAAGNLFHKLLGLAGSGEGVDRTIPGQATTGAAAMIETKTVYSGRVDPLRLADVERQTLGYSLEQQRTYGTVPIRIHNLFYVDISTGAVQKYVY